MFGDLFQEEEPNCDDTTQSTSSSHHGIPRPISPRNKTKLCGMSNLGATCYMNALLQTLFYTPELRDSLFALTREELGIGGDSGRLRDIPAQLQNLFARLLLADQDTVGVEGLVSSFGWTNNEQMQQHDVQELNRILFDALESSLVGTSGQQIISHLFHGVSVQQVTCEQCTNMSEREESFLDISVALTGKAGLEAALKEMYCGVELLDGNNQYRCERCNCLVDAKRRSCVRTVPPILTFNLLRFLYDFDKGERYKDLSRFQFPQSLNMSPYLDCQKEDENTDAHIYDLFSVVIHSGSTHSGHYIAYIKDIDQIGVWTPPEDKPVSMQVTSDVLEFNSPLDLLKTIIEQCGGKATINKICKQLSEQTGVTWNKRFKQQFGPITKFVRQCTDVFEIDSANVVSFKDQATPIISNRETPPTSTTSTPVKEEEMTQPASDGAPEPLHDKLTLNEEVWFEFNDSHVSCIRSSAIDKMFSGRQSAYMLFYRLRSLNRPKEALRNPSYGVPQWLQEEIATTNAVLDADRHQYDTAVNTVSLTIHPSVYYEYRNGALQNTADGLTHTIKIDRRRTIAELQAMIIEEIGEPGVMPNGMNINIAKQIPAGLHLYDCISDDTTVILMDKGIVNDSHLFIWNGITVNHQVVPIGTEYEPILLHLNYPAGPEGTLTKVSCGFIKTTTISELRQHFASLLDCSPSEIVLNQVKRSTRSGDASVQSIPFHKDKNTLSEFLLVNGDHITAELKGGGTKRGYRSFAYSVADKQNKMVTFLVENRCVSASDGELLVYPVEAAKNEQLKQVKSHVKSQLGLADVEGGGRFRVDDDFEGLGPSLCEELSVQEAGIESGMRVILEPGHAPATNQIPLKCSIDKSFTEVILDRSCTIKECCSIMVATLGLEGSEWHLRKANWMGELGEIVDDESATIEQLKFRDGDRFLIKEGRLPPKCVSDTGTSLSVGDWFNGGALPQMLGIKREAEDDNPEMMETTTTTTTEELPLHEQNPSLYYPTVPGTMSCIGSIEINKESTVNELKELIMTLPQLSDSDIPSCDFLRVRDLVNGRPTRVFKDKTHSLKRLKLVSGSSICCQILPNEEALSATSVLFNMYMRQVDLKTYSCPIEVVYDLADSTTPTGLCKHVGNLLATPIERLVLAKHKYESFQWIRIEGHATMNENKGKKKGKGGGAAKGGGGAKGGSHVNIKNAPISLRDGDDIGVKDLQFDPEDKDNFETLNDEKGKSILAAIQEEKRRRRKLKSEENEFLSTGDSRNKKQRRPEIGIKIFVPDFTKDDIASTQHRNEC